MSSESGPSAERVPPPRSSPANASSSSPAREPSVFHRFEPCRFPVPNWPRPRYTSQRLPVRRYANPDLSRMFEAEAAKMGFSQAASGAMVRSSYHADQQAHAAGFVATT